MLAVQRRGLLAVQRGEGRQPAPQLVERLVITSRGREQGAGAAPAENVGEPHVVVGLGDSMTLARASPDRAIISMAPAARIPWKVGPTGRPTL